MFQIIFEVILIKQLEIGYQCQLSLFPLCTIYQFTVQIDWMDWIQKQQKTKPQSIQICLFLSVEYTVYIVFIWNSQFTHRTNYYLNMIQFFVVNIFCLSKGILCSFIASGIFCCALSAMVSCPQNKLSDIRYLTHTHEYFSASQRNALVLCVCYSWCSSFSLVRILCIFGCSVFIENRRSFFVNWLGNFWNIAIFFLQNMYVFTIHLSK